MVEGTGLRSHQAEGQGPQRGPEFLRRECGIPWSAGRMHKRQSPRLFLLQEWEPEAALDSAAFLVSGVSVPLHNLCPA